MSNAALHVAASSDEDSTARRLRHERVDRWAVTPEHRLTILKKAMVEHVKTRWSTKAAQEGEEYCQPIRENCTLQDRLNAYRAFETGIAEWLRRWR